MRRVNAWWVGLPQETRARVKHAVVVGAAAIGGVVAAGEAVCIAIDSSKTLQRCILASLAYRGSESCFKFSPTTSLEWEKAEFSLWRGRVTFHGVKFTSLKHAETDEVYFKAKAGRVGVSLRPALSLKSLVRSIDVHDVDSFLDLSPAAYDPLIVRMQRKKKHPALSIDSPADQEQQQMKAAQDLLQNQLAERLETPHTQRVDFNIGRLSVENGSLQLIPPWKMFMFVSCFSCCVIISGCVFICHFLLYTGHH